MKPQALILCGDGINCEIETEFALGQAGFMTSLVHVSNIIENPEKLNSSQLFVIPGGFSFGDEIASGKVLALKLKDHLRQVIEDFVARDSLLLAICNGFQVLVQLGILPNGSSLNDHKATLVRNKSTKFSNRWVKMNVTPNTNCQFLTSLKTIELPMRHGEGRLVIKEGEVNAVKEEACLRYTEDVNGSYDQIAGLTNKSGNVMGLMPHPEAFVRSTQHPSWTTQKRPDDHLPDGLSIFQNAFKGVTSS
jgi:phosphoribosylformylglycinamidine (FGAM) synthase-like amidotransferase family enzyme